MHLVRFIAYIPGIIKCLKSDNVQDLEEDFWVTSIPTAKLIGQSDINLQLTLRMMIKLQVQDASQCRTQISLPRNLHCPQTLQTRKLRLNSRIIVERNVSFRVEE